MAPSFYHARKVLFVATYLWFYSIFFYSILFLFSFLSFVFFSTKRLISFPTNYCEQLSLCTLQRSDSLSLNSLLKISLVLSQKIFDTEGSLSKLSRRFSSKCPALSFSIMNAQSSAQAFLAVSVRFLLSPHSRVQSMKPSARTFQNLLSMQEFWMRACMRPISSKWPPTSSKCSKFVTTLPTISPNSLVCCFKNVSRVPYFSIGKSHFLSKLLPFIL